MGKNVKLLSIALLNYLIFGLFALEYLRRGSSQNVRDSFGNLTLLVIAHPDDETMFFGPTILNLVHNEKYLEILCLTNGNADNMGEKRVDELAQVVRRLGPNVTLKQISDDELPDSMSKSWDLIRVSNLIEAHLRTSSSQFETLVTFDQDGVSGHLNHKSIHWATEHLMTKIKDLKLRVFNLKSLSWLRKYSSYMDSLVVMYQNLLYTSKTSHVTLAVGTSNIEVKRLLNLHASQMVWFRKLYMIFSRYMFINDLIERSPDESQYLPDADKFVNKVDGLQ